MSLVVWLPLTKDLRQQGLDNITVTTANTNNFQNEGKLSNKSLDVSGHYAFRVPSLVKKRVFSCAFWYKPITDSSLSDNWRRIIVFDTYTSDGSTTGSIFRFESSYGYQSSSTTYCISIHNNAGEPIASIGTGLGEIDGWNKWQHIAITADGTTLKCYRNGVQVASGNMGNGGMLQGTVHIGYSGNRPIGRLNDFRLYDHCLSPMEVKELAKGLVLHYPLNRNGWGQENLLSRYVVPGQAAPTSTAAGGRTTWLGDYKITIPATENADTYFRLFTTKQLTANATYTISCQVSGLKEGSYYRFPLYAQSNTGMGVLQLDHNGLCSLTFTMTYGTQTAATGANGETVYICFMDDSTRSIASGQGAITVSDLKLEEGSIATPWCPNSSDALATTMGLNSTTEYDCSGFCNNGTRTGTFTWTSDTSKYAVSQDCIGTNYIHLTPPSTEVQTIAIWANWKAIPSGQSVILVDNGSGIGLGLMNTGILCSTSGAGSSYTFSKANLIANTWYHFVVVKTGATTRKLYINGVEQTATSNTSNWTFAVNELQLGKRSTTSDGFIGKLSDFRAYATALSADDVKSLYQNCAYIDSSGNVYGAVHMEV